MNPDLNKGTRVPKEPREGTGVVPLHHKLKLGQTDGVKDPQGAGQPSRDNKIPNDGGGRKTW